MLPDELLSHILLYSGPNEIYNVCTTNKNNYKLCDAHFWNHKHNMEDLPITIYKNCMISCINTYKLLKDYKLEAIKLLKMYAIVNYDKDEFSFKIILGKR